MSKLPGLNLIRMPAEVLDQIFQYLQQSDLRILIRVHESITGAAEARLYRSPEFASSYRLAQFAHNISHTIRYSSLVRNLVLPSSFVDEEQDGLAGWREFKYRAEPLYAPRVREQRFSYHHPPSSERLDHRPSGLPLGIVLHILTACTNLR